MLYRVKNKSALQEISNLCRFHPLDPIVYRLCLMSDITIYTFEASYINFLIFSITVFCKS
jgi:hypothetical protein